MGILDTQNLNDTLLGNFRALDNPRAPFGKRGQYNTGENPSSNEYFGGFSYASDETTREAFGTDAAATRRGPIGMQLNQGSDFKYGTDGQARLSNSQTTLLGQAAKMTAAQVSDFGTEGTAAQIAKLWTSSNQLRNLRDTQTGSGKGTSGYDDTNSYGISNFNIDQSTRPDQQQAAEKTTASTVFDQSDRPDQQQQQPADLDQSGRPDQQSELYEKQFPMATGLVNIGGIRDSFPLTRSADVTTTLNDFLADKSANDDDLGYSSGRA